MFRNTLSLTTAMTAMTVIALPAFAQAPTRSSANANATVKNGATEAHLSLSVTRIQNRSGVFEMGRLVLMGSQNGEHFGAISDSPKIVFTSADTCTVTGNYIFRNVPMRAEIYLKKNSATSAFGWKLVRISDNAVMSTSGNALVGAVQLNTNWGSIALQNQ